jgi:hypothetical protein
MRFGRVGITRPEQFPKKFNVYQQSSTTSERGRERLEPPVPKCSARCILAEASQDERLRFSQIGVNVTHSIIQRGAPVANDNDVFALSKTGVETRRFRVQAVHDKGEMGIDTVYYCEERGDQP